MTHMKQTKKFVIDANVFVSALTRNEVYHFSSKAFLDFIYNNGINIAVPMLVVFETFHSLRKNGSIKTNKDYLRFKRIFNNSNCKYVENDIKLFKFFKEFRFFEKLKTSDAIIATIAFVTKSLLITWDKQLLEKSHNAYTPEDFLKKFG